MIVGHLRAHERDAAIAGRDDRLRHLPPGAVVRDAHGMVDGVAVDIHDLDDRNPGPCQHRARSGGVFQPRDDHARRPPGQHFIDHMLFAVGQIVRHPHHGLQAGALQHGRDAGHHLGEHHVGQ